MCTFTWREGGGGGDGGGGGGERERDLFFSKVSAESIIQRDVLGISQVQRNRPMFMVYGLWFSLDVCGTSQVQRNTPMLRV
jgi:hypothetical protein